MVREADAEDDFAGIVAFEAIIGGYLGGTVAK